MSGATTGQYNLKVAITAGERRIFHPQKTDWQKFRPYFPLNMVAFPVNSSKLHISNPLPRNWLTNVKAPEKHSFAGGV